MHKQYLIYHSLSHKKSFSLILSNYNRINYNAAKSATSLTMNLQNDIKSSNLWDYINIRHLEKSSRYNIPINLKQKGKQNQYMSFV
jgi:hypothetical protein